MLFSLTQSFDVCDGSGVQGVLAVAASPWLTVMLHPAPLMSPTENPQINKRAAKDNPGPFPAWKAI